MIEEKIDERTHLPQLQADTDFRQTQSQRPAPVETFACVRAGHVLNRVQGFSLENQETQDYTLTSEDFERDRIGERGAFLESSSTRHPDDYTNHPQSGG